MNLHMIRSGGKGGQKMNRDMDIRDEDYGPIYRGLCCGPYCIASFVKWVSSSGDTGADMMTQADCSVDSPPHPIFRRVDIVGNLL